MSAQSLFIPKLQDEVIISSIEKAAKILERYNPTASISAFGHIYINFNPLTPNNEVELKHLISKNSTLIESLTFSAGGFSFSFYRGGNHSPKSGFIDELAFNSNNQSQVNSEDKIDFIATLAHELKALDKNKVIPSRISQEQLELEAIHQATLDRLERINESLIRETQEYRLKLEKDFSEKGNRLQEKSERTEEKLAQDYQEKIAALRKSEDDLEQKRKDLDDKNNTHARRQIRKDIIVEIKRRQTEFKLTNGTNNLRRPVGFAMLGLVLVFTVMAIVSIYDVHLVMQNSNINALWISGIKQVIYSAGAIGSLLFYIRWQNRWFEQHSLAEFQLKQFELDMERASWIVETSLEWKDAKGTSIPVELLNSLSNNLFRENKDKVDQLVHPADQLASAILGSAAMIKLKAGDSEIQVDPKKLLKAKNTEVAPSQ